MNLTLSSKSWIRRWFFAVVFLFLGTSSVPAQTLTNNSLLTYNGYSTAGSATITNTDNMNSQLLFEDHATAGSASIYNGHSDVTNFEDASTAGSAAVTNNGVIYFSGDGDGVNFSTAGNCTIANNGLVQFNDYSSAGSAAITNADNDSNSLDFLNNATAGNAVISNGVSDTMEFEDESTAGSASIVNNGSLYFSGDGGGVTFSTAGNSTITNGYYVEFDDYSTAGSATLINGDGLGSGLGFYNNSTAGNAVILNGSGDDADFNDDSTAGSAAISNAGVLAFNNESTAGSANITNSWIIDFNDASTAGSAAITNNGTVYFNGGGNGVTFATAGNATITNNDDLYFEDYSTAGSANIITTGGGGLFFLDHAIGGDAQLTVNGSGFVDFSDSVASQTQGTEFTVGSIAGSGLFYLGQVDLVTGSNDLSTTLTGSINNGGDTSYTGASLTKVGAGTFVLAGDNYYTGGTNIDAGTLAVESQQSLGGGGVSVNGGNLAIEGPVTLMVNDYYTQSAGSTLTLGLSTPASQGELAVDGAATFNGSLAVTSVGSGSPTVGQSFWVVDTTGGVNGTFSSVDSELSSFRFLPVYQTGDVILETLPGSFAELGTTRDEKAVGGAFDNMFSDPHFYNLMKSLGTQSVSQLTADLKPLDPSGLTPLFRMGFAAADSQAQIIGRRLDGLLDISGLPQSGFAKYGSSPMFASTLPAGDEKAQTDQMASEGRMGLFLEGEGNFGDITGDGNAAGYSFSMGGMAAGFDYRLAKDLVGGLLLGYDQSGTGSVNGNNVTSTGGQVGLYGGWKQNGWRLEAMLDGGLNQYKTNRDSLGGTASGSTQGLQFGGKLDVGYDMKDGSFTAGPFASCQYTYVRMNAYQETGAMPESFPSQGQGAFTTQFGVREGTRWSLGGAMNLAPTISAAWEHWFQGSTDFLTSNFGTAGSSFTVAGPGLGSDAAVLGAGLEAQFAEGFGASVQYQGKLGLTNYSSQSLNGSIDIGF